VRKGLPCRKLSKRSLEGGSGEVQLTIDGVRSQNLLAESLLRGVINRGIIHFVGKIGMRIFDTRGVLDNRHFPGIERVLSFESFQSAF
jgi:hypothetical protein